MTYWTFTSKESALLIGACFVVGTGLGSCFGAAYGLSS